MVIVARDILVKFHKKHASAKKPLEAWLTIVENAKWKNTSDVKLEFPSASFLSENRIVFNIGGNNYRLLVTVVFAKGMLLILRAGTHADYDKWKL